MVLPSIRFGFPGTQSIANAIKKQYGDRVLQASTGYQIFEYMP